MISHLYFGSFFLPHNLTILVDRVCLTFHRFCTSFLFLFEEIASVLHIVVRNVEDDVWFIVAATLLRLWDWIYEKQ